MAAFANKEGMQGETSVVVIIALIKQLNLIRPRPCVGATDVDIVPCACCIPRPAPLALPRLAHRLRMRCRLRWGWP
ncbi:hypothetical protein XFF6166_880084 [Xanthomonas citri pv. fuscans]|nr:hypothetical protein XFF6166_880084 [Xanthomonas citri pv. fuscans]SOO04438.1 hypothetical protein XFF6960_970084 [Xanthomonas citri pv. fuscans]SOO07439.1 hypothetical protein XFF7767_970015 [Xanthomonas citri pv. fuscans]SOO08137.1 hypothetical protein XFF6970_150080 [Xanthomonas citri pv. fuscans]SOO13506.1 hypothetical protein XFF7766_180079 [Xanthomonas citri pv. fuscans]